MNKVVFYRKNGYYVGFEASGHTGYDDIGYDIVCAAVSALTLTAVNSIDELTDIRQTVEIDDEKGFLKCYTDYDDEYKTDVVQTIYKFLFIGIKGIVEMHDQYVELHLKEV